MSRPSWVAEPNRRHFTAVATSEYSVDYRKPLNTAGSVAVLTDWLCSEHLGDRRFTHVHPDLAGDPELHQIRDAFEHPMWSSDDAVIVYVTGHGERGSGYDSTSHWLILNHTGEVPNFGTALRTSDLIGWLNQDRHETTMLVIDTCYANAVRAVGSTRRAELRDGLLVLASTDSDREATSGVLTEAVADFLREVRSDRGTRFGDGRYLLLRDFLIGVGERMDRRGQTLWRVNHRDSATEAPHVCLPNPRFRAPGASAAPARAQARIPTSRAEADLRFHWEPKAVPALIRWPQDSDEIGEHPLARRLRYWAESESENEPAVIVVSGPSGCGKTTALARLVLGGLADGAVVATGCYPHQVVDELLAVTGLETSTAAGDLVESVALLSARIRGAGTGIRVVIDSLDAAADPVGVVELLGSLTRFGDHESPVRLAIGLRTADRGLDHRHPEAKRLNELKTHARERALWSAKWLDASEDELWSRPAFEAFISDTLQSAPNSKFRTDPRRADAAVRQIAARSGRSFLLAGATAAVLARQELPDPEADGRWLDHLGPGLVDVLRETVAGQAADAQERRRIVGLLRALAFSRGRGIPWSAGLWAKAGSAVWERFQTSYQDDDILELLNSPLSGFILEDREDAVPVYRLSHEEIRTILRYHDDELLAEGKRP